MATPAAVLSILLEANTGKATSQLRGMQGQLQQVNRHATDTERASGKLGKTMGGLSVPAASAGKSIGGLAKAAIAAGAAFAGFEAVKSAIESTGELAAATIKLSAVTGLDAKQASLWIEVMKVRGVQTKAVTMAFITLSRNIRNAGEGSKTAVKAFDQLGIATKSLPGESTEQVLLRVAQGLSNLKSPAERAAIAQQLFGRGAQALIPVLSQGRAGVDAMLAAAERYGAFLPKNVKIAEGAVQAQHNLNLAFDGLKIAFTEAVLPSLVKGADALLKFIGQVRSGTGAGGQFGSTLKTAFALLKGAVEITLPALRLLLSVVSSVAHFLGRNLTAALVAVGIALAVGSPLIAGITGLLIVLSHLHQVARGLGIVWGAVWGGIKRVTGEVVIFILGLFSTMLGGIAKVAGVFSHLPGPLGAPFRALKTAALDGEHAIDRFRNKVKVWDGETKTYSASIARHFETMANNVGISIIAARDAIHSGSRLAAKYAIGNFNAIAGQIQVAMSSGQISTQEGAKLIAQALQDAMTAFGSGKIPGVGKVLAAAYPGLPKFTKTSPALQATGGLIQVGRKGAGGRDNVPMNVGGVPIVVGEGEQVAVFTRHQQKVANQALAGYGGLPGLFSKVNKPNYMATGGYVYPFPAGTTIGRTDEGIDASMPAGSPIGAIGPAQVMGIHPDWYKSQPLVWEKLTAGPMAGRLIYLAEQISSIASGTLTANQALARFASSGTGIEMGWADSTGYPAAASHYTEGQVTAEGTDFRNFIMGLAHGIITGGAVGGAGGLAGPVWKNIGVPTVQGTGTIPSMVRGALTMLTAQANKFGASKVGPASVGSVGGTGSITAANLAAIAKSLGYNWDGTQIHDWLTIISQESGGNPTAQNPTSTAYGIGQFLDSTWGLYGTSAKTSDPHLQLVDMAKYIHGKYGTPAAAEAYHLAHNSYGQGGLLPQFFASGGPISTAEALATGRYSGFGSNWVGPRSRQTPPKPKGGTNIGLKQLAGKDMGPINKAMGELNNLIGDTGDIARLQERYQAFDSLFQALHPNLQYLVQPADGSAAYIDDAAVKDSLAELLQLQAWEQQIIGDYQRVQKLAPQVLKAIDTAIKVRRQAIEQLKAKIRANLAKIAALEKLITVAQKAKNTTLVAQYKKQVGVLKSDNATLGGSATSVGTTGRIGALSAEITALQDRSGKAGDMLVSAQGITGAGGGLATENVNLIGLQQQIKPLQDWVTSKGGSLAVQLQQAAAPAQDANLQNQLALQEQLTTQAQQALGVSQAQYQALEGLPFAGSFAAGGVVPGPVGAPAVAVVHGGEGIGMPGETNVNIHFANGMEWLRQFITVEVAKRDRGTGRTVGRGLPGAGGGI